VRGSAILRDVRQLTMLPLRRETIYHLVFNPHGAEQSSLNRLIAADPGLALAVLRLAPRSCREDKLGIAQFGRFASPAAVFELVRVSSENGRFISGESDLGMDKLWLHSVATSHATRHLSRSRNYPHPQTAFLAGMLHNLGLLALAAVAPDEVADLLSSNDTNDAEKMLASEEKRFGASHTTIGNQISKRWGLPAWLQEVLWWHHQPENTMPHDLSDRALVSLVRESDLLISSGQFSLCSATDSTTWALPWKIEDPLAAAVLRGVRQAATFVQDHPLKGSPDELSKQVARAVDLATQNVSLHAEYDWRKQAWDQYVALPPDAAPADLSGIVAETYARALGALGALCYVRNTDGSAADGTFWCDGPRAISLSLEQGNNAKPHSDQLIARLRPVWQQRPKLVVNLEYGEEHLAHVLVWLDEFAAAPNDVVWVQVRDLCTSWFANATHVAQLENQLESLTATLREQAVRADAVLEKSKLAALAEMAAGAGHEINNPLAVITGRAQLLIAEETDPQRRKSLETIVAQAQRIHRMIVDLMTFARPPASHCKPVSISDVIDRAIGLVQREADEKRIRFTVTGGAELPQVSADLAQLALAFECVLRNSLEATDENGTIQVIAERDDQAGLSIKVIDAGRGITDDQRQHIFEPFYSGRDAGRGLGMGLPKAWRLIQGHGGEIQVSSSPQGTTVTIRLRALAASDQNRACA